MLVLRVEMVRVRRRLRNLQAVQARTIPGLDRRLSDGHEERPMKAMVCLQSWAGYTEHPVEIIGETRTRYRVRALESFKLPRRWIHKDGVALVPKHAVKIVKEGNHAQHDS
jgi:hypothetical protein